jgi:FkbM family methyltransferase
MGLRNQIRHTLYRLGVPGVTNYFESGLARLSGDLTGSYSQHREDIYIQAYFQHQVGTYIEIGANHPIKLSPTYLLYRAGWKGLTVEPIPHLYRMHQSIRKHDQHLNAAAGESSSKLKFFEIIPDVFSTFDQDQADRLVASGAILAAVYEMDVLTLSDIYQKYFAGQSVDFISIDTEMYDLQVLMGNDWSVFRPRLIMCEDSLEAKITDFLTNVHYKMIQRIGYNIFFEDMN